MSELSFRPAVPADTGTIIEFIRMLAANEGRPDAATITEDKLQDLLFGTKAVGQGFLAIDNGKPIASALTLLKFSSYRGNRVLYIEDLIVSREARGKGVGAKMMKYLARTAIETGCDAMEWFALKSDPSALRFYERFGAQYDDQHAILGLDKLGLKKLQEF